MAIDTKGLKRLYSNPILRTIYHNNPFTKLWKSRTENRLNRMFNRGIVLNGPFKGMNYPLKESRCSAFFPKIIGSYETELHPVFEKLRAFDFTEIVDIGCAEGYYACGLSLMFKNAHSYAYDIDPKARALCNLLAQSNKISKDRLSIMENCDADQLKSITFHRGLIVSDCEGYEVVLFKGDVIDHLRNCHIIIECHNNLEEDTRIKIQQRFTATHKATIINSISDFDKINTYHYITTQLSNFEKWYLYAERRGITMEWLLLEPVNP